MLRMMIIMIMMMFIKEWIQDLRRITHNTKANNVCPTTCLKKQSVLFSITYFLLQGGSKQQAQRTISINSILTCNKSRLLSRILV